MRISSYDFNLLKILKEFENNPKFEHYWYGRVNLSGFCKFVNSELVRQCIKSNAIMSYVVGKIIKFTF